MELAPLAGAEVSLPDELRTVRLAEVRAVVEGSANRTDGPETVTVLRAQWDGDAEIVAEADRLTAAGRTPLVVTADRGLRRRLPQPAIVVGPGWLNRLLGR